MAILTLQDTQLAYGELPLLDRAALAMESGKRLGLIGSNGTGKSRCSAPSPAAWRWTTASCASETACASR